MLDWEPIVTVEWRLLCCQSGAGEANCMDTVTTLTADKLSDECVGSSEE